MGASGTLPATDSVPPVGPLMPIVGGTFFKTKENDDATRISCVIELLQRMCHINSMTNENGTAIDHYPVIIADASPGSMHDYLAELFEAFGAIVLDARDRPGIGTQNQMAIAHAYDLGAEYIIRTELEKYGLADLDVLGPILHTLDQKRADILCIGREPGAAYESLPPYQQITERIMSRAIAGLGLPEDSACGLRAMNRRATEYFLEFDTTGHGNQWEILWLPLLDAIGGGLAVDGLFVPLMHPPGITQDETDNPLYNYKRDQQAAQIIPAVVNYANGFGIYPEWDPNRVWVI